MIFSIYIFTLLHSYTTNVLNFKMLIIFVLLSSSVTATALLNASMTPALMRDMSTLYLVHQKDGQARFLEGFDWSHKKIRYTYCRFATKIMELKGIIILLENLNCLLGPNCFPVQLSCFRYIVFWRFEHPICLFSLHPTTRFYFGTEDGAMNEKPWSRGRSSLLFLASWNCTKSLACGFKNPLNIFLCCWLWKMTTTTTTTTWTSNIYTATGGHW